MSETLIKVEGVSKKFCRSLKKSLWYGMQDLGREITGRHHGGDGELRPDEFWAVKDVSFELKRGECLGLIGRNGAGKTTLLKMLNGLIKPDRGRIAIRGRVSALIALGAGFNPLLSGRENIYVNASVLGLSKQEIDKKINEIIHFSEIQDFIDAPVQTYSSGMQVRLGFSVATALNPDVLILDEVLAVGDASFRSKCYRRISEIKRNAAIIFVSHSMEQVARISNLSLVLKSGEPIYIGDVRSGVRYYEKLNDTTDSESEVLNELALPITSFDATPKHQVVTSGDSLKIRFLIESESILNDPQFRIYIYDAAGVLAAEGIFEPKDHSLVINTGVNNYLIEIKSLTLRSGIYKISINILNPEGELIVWCRYENVIEVNGGHPGAIAHYLINDAEISRA